MSTKRFRISEIASCLQAQHTAKHTGDAVISCLLTNSRHLLSPEGCLFFALADAHHDGHHEIEELYNKGVRHFVVHDIPEKMKDKADADFLLVKNTTEALLYLAAEHRKRFTMPVVGITGSSGTSVVTEWLAYLLSDNRKVMQSVNYHRSLTGAPLSVWEMQSGYDIAVFEAQPPHTGDMQCLQAVIQPTMGIITNFDGAHDELSDKQERKIEEMLELFTGVQRLILCKDHGDIREQIANHPELKNVSVCTWGKTRGSDLRWTGTTLQDGKTTLTATYRKEQLSITIPFAGKEAIENAMHCWAFLLAMKCPQAMIAERMQTLPVVDVRMQIKEAINNCSLINDSYHSGFNTLPGAVECLHRQQQHAKRTVILSDIPPGSLDEESVYTGVARLLANKNISRIIGIGQVIAKHSDKFTMEKSFFPDTETFLSNFPLSGFCDETILLKGARTFAFEKIDNALQQKTYKTKLEIDLNAVTHNLNYFRSKVSSGVRLMVMVKAFSYGNGSFEIANVLQSQQVDYLGVASTDEGMELREAGIQMPIMVINPDEQSFGRIIDYHLEPEIYNLRTWHALRDYVQHRQPPAPVAVHIKLDTGMHRLGFEEKDLPQLLQELQKIRQESSEQPAIRIASVFSHLAASDNSQLDRFTHRQIVTFRRMSKQVQAACSYPVCYHILNSAGIVRFHEAQFDMVRLGIGLYGIGANELEQQRLQNVSALKTVIAQIKQLSAGETVGYNRNHKVIREMRVGVIPIGYADGLPRKFGNGKGSVWVNEKLAPVIGNVCMDMCMIDLTNIPAQENDEVVIFGDQQPVTEVAKMLETIPYEVFTGIARRVKRVYYWQVEN